MVADLARRRLAQINIGWPAPVMFRDLGIHQLPPPRWAKPWDRCRARLRAYWPEVCRPIPHRSVSGGQKRLGAWQDFRAPRGGGYRCENLRMRDRQPLAKMASVRSP